MHKFVYIPVIEHFSFAKRIHPPDRCGIWFNSMIITHVHLVLGTIKGQSKMCGFVTQDNATDVASFEGLCNWHAACRNVHQSCFQRISCSFLYHKLPPTSYQPHNRGSRQSRTSTSGFFTFRIVWDQPPRKLMKLRSISVCSKAIFLAKNTFWLAGPGFPVGGPMTSQAYPWLRPCPVTWNP